MRTPFLLVVPVFLLLSVTSVRAAGPVWTVRDIDQFQDNFSSDGTITGVVRADMANDILPASSPGILPGDSAVVAVTDLYGLKNDEVLGGSAVYCYVAVEPFGQPGKSGAALSGGTRWPLAGTEVINGISWTKLRMDQSNVDGVPVPETFCIDLNDDLFTPGDTIFFFYAATSNNLPGTTNYFSLETGTTFAIGAAAAFPMEFTCLPAGGFNRGGAELFVNSAEDGVREYWDSALRILGLNGRVDRYDVRGAADGGNNHLASRVHNIAAQLNACWQGIYWDTGSLPITLGDGSGAPQKTDDFALLNSFLNNLTNGGGILLFGDNVAEQLASNSSPSASDFKSTFMPFTLVSGDQAPTFGLAPTVIHWPFRTLSDDFVAYGAGPPVKDFDVVQATGTSRLEATYGPNAASSGAIVSNQTVNGNGKTATVLLCGFSFADIRDNDQNGISDRAKCLRDLNIYTSLSLPQVTVAGPALASSLPQNYPNPFNPQTSIAFSLASRGHVQLSVYDVNGSLVRTLASEMRAAGAYELRWDGRDTNGHHVASGVYFYRLVAPGFTQTRKMVLLK